MATAEVHHTHAIDTSTRETAIDIAAFTEVRPRLFAIAYRILQSAAEAEDVVQEVWLRWQQTNRGVVQDVPAFLATTTTRLCLNIAQSARSRRETSDGPWLPERIDTQANPELGAIRNAGLEHAIEMLLERLSPTERAAYILREAFDYSYSQIAEVLRIAEANSRQLVVRARKHLGEGRRSSITSTAKKRLLDTFVHAAQMGDLTALESVLARDVAAFAWTARSVSATQLRAFGRNRIQKFVDTMSSKLWNGGRFARSQVSEPLVQDGPTLDSLRLDLDGKTCKKTPSKKAEPITLEFYGIGVRYDKEEDSYRDRRVARDWSGRCSSISGS